MFRIGGFASDVKKVLPSVFLSIFAVGSAFAATQDTSVVWTSGSAGTGTATGTLGSAIGVTVSTFNAFPVLAITSGWSTDAASDAGGTITYTSQSGITLETAGATTQTISFTGGTLVNPILMFDYVSTTGSYVFPAGSVLTPVSSSNCVLAALTITCPTSTRGTNDGIAVELHGTFGPGAPITFTYNDSVNATDGFSIAISPFVPEDSGFQVRYAANLGLGESYINITNDGANGASFSGPGFGTQAGNICVNVYAFDPNEELIACCSCLITPDQTVNLGVNADLTSKTLTGVVPGSITVKLLATTAASTTSGGNTTYNCTNSAALAGTGNFTLVPNGMAAWGTTLHQNATLTSLVTTETPFTAATLSSGAAGSNNELQSITGRCQAIVGNASGFGLCTSCRSGAIGATKF